MYAGYVFKALVLVLEIPIHVIVEFWVWCNRCAKADSDFKLPDYDTYSTTTLISLRLILLLRLRDTHEDRHDHRV